jgi:hypothetical protein
MFHGRGEGNYILVKLWTFTRERELLCKLVWQINLQKDSLGSNTSLANTSFVTYKCYSWIHSLLFFAVKTRAKENSLKLPPHRRMAIGALFLCERVRVSVLCCQFHRKDKIYCTYKMDISMLKSMTPRRWRCNLIFCIKIELMEEITVQNGRK